MTDQQANIVPFGKGRSIEEVLSRLSAMGVGRTGSEPVAVLNQVIINRGAELQETPEPNAHVRFLDDDFCLRSLSRARVD